MWIHAYKWKHVAIFGLNNLGFFTYIFHSGVLSCTSEIKIFYPTVLLLLCMHRKQRTRVDHSDRCFLFTLFFLKAPNSEINFYSRRIICIHVWSDFGLLKMNM